MMERAIQRRISALAVPEAAGKTLAGPHRGKLAQLAATLNGRTMQRRPAPNRTGLPDRLKTGVEALSGLSMDHVRVHRNSPKPATLQAHAYAQGSEIHLGPGQERHLPHEAWHVVQQMQGRVRPTTRLNGVKINDHAGLEAEATSSASLAMNSPLVPSEFHEPSLRSSTLQPKTMTGLPAGTASQLRTAQSSIGVAQLMTDAEIETQFKEDSGNLKMATYQSDLILRIVKLDGWGAFRGGHVQLRGPDFYNFCRKIDKKKARGKGIWNGSLPSSHYTTVAEDQFEIQLPFSWLGSNWGTVLVGKNATGDSWFQVEGHSGVLGDSYLRFAWDVLAHGADFVQHKRYFTGAPVVNVGPFGTDPASEKTGSARMKTTGRRS